MSDFIQSLTKKPQYDSDEIHVQSISIDKIKPDEKQVRESFDQDKIEELADSIKSKGLLNPIHVRLVEKDYIVLTGERRYRACKMTGMESIPCIVHEEKLTESEIRSLQLIENLQRENLGVLETARAFSNLIKDGMKKRQIAVNLGISESSVSRYTSVLSKIPEDWIKTIEQTSKEVSLNDLYEIAKETNKTKKAMTYKKLLENLGKQIEIEIEEKAKEEKKKEIPGEFTEEELNKVWEVLIREKRRDIRNLALYLSPKKMRTLLEDKEL